MKRGEKAIHIAIVGSRNYPRPEIVRSFVATLPAESIVVSGGAAGVDNVAEEAAKSAGFETLIFPTDWDGLGRNAVPIRNAEIVAVADRIVAFWDGRSRCIANTILQATGRKLPIELYGPAGEPLPVEQALRAAGQTAR